LTRTSRACLLLCVPCAECSRSFGQRSPAIRRKGRAEAQVGAWHVQLCSHPLASVLAALTSPVACLCAPMRACSRQWFHPCMGGREYARVRMCWELWRWGQRSPFAVWLPAAGCLPPSTTSLPTLQCTRCCVKTTPLATLFECRWSVAHCVCVCVCFGARPGGGSRGGRHGCVWLAGFQVSLLRVPAARRQLVKDDRVKFAGYQIRHPLEKDVYLMVQTDDSTCVAPPPAPSPPHLRAHTHAHTHARGRVCAGKRCVYVRMCGAPGPVIRGDFAPLQACP
jgi:hypothetical protein